MRVKQTKKQISQKTWKEAESISKGLYKMNARTAFAYAFNVKKNEISYGEFMFMANGDDERIKDFDGYIDFRS